MNRWGAPARLFGALDGRLALVRLLEALVERINDAVVLLLNAHGAAGEWATVRVSAQCAQLREGPLPEQSSSAFGPRARLADPRALLFQTALALLQGALHRLEHAHPRLGRRLLVAQILLLVLQLIQLRLDSRGHLALGQVEGRLHFGLQTEWTDIAEMGAFKAKRLVRLRW